MATTQHEDQDSIKKAGYQNYDCQTQPNIKIAQENFRWPMINDDLVLLHTQKILVSL